MKLFSESNIKLGMAIMFLLCLFNWSYGFYELVRFLGMIGFIYLGYLEYERGNKKMAWLWFGSAILINPLLKIALGRIIWNIVDMIWAVVLLMSRKRVLLK